MANKIVLKKSSVPAKAPIASDLDYGELALNYADGKLYYKNSSNEIEVFTKSTGNEGVAGVSSVDSYTGDVTSAQIFNAVKKEDGTGSELDADLLDGQHGSYYLDWTNTTNKPSLFSGSYNDLTDKPSLFSGDYADLINKPSLFSGSYNDLTDKPTLFSGSYTDLTNKPSFATVATSGSYNDLTDKPTIPSLTGYATETYVNTAISNLVDGAPTALDTLKEIADQLADDESVVSALITTVDGKVSLTGSYTDPTWLTLTSSKVGLGNVENTALSTWAGSTNITTLGIVATGTWSASNIGLDKGGTNASLTAVAGGAVYSTGSGLAITAAGTAGQVLTSNGTSAPTWQTPTGGGGGGSSSWAKKTADYTAVTGDKIIADTTSAGFTITLPASPSAGDNISIADGNNWYTNNLTVDRNGNTIEGLSENFTLDINGIMVELVYDGTTWELFSLGGGSANAKGAGGDQVFFENGTSVTTSYSITNGMNAMSAGPITILSDAAVTIPSGSTWTIV